MHSIHATFRLLVSTREPLSMTTAWVGPGVVLFGLACSALVGCQVITTSSELAITLQSPLEIEFKSGPVDSESKVAAEAKAPSRTSAESAKTAKVAANTPTTNTKPPQGTPDRDAVERLLLTTRKRTIGETAIDEEVEAWVRLRSGSDAGFRWYHSGLASILKDSPQPELALRSVLASEQPAVRAAATIGLARLEGTEHLDLLLGIVAGGRPAAPVKTKEANALPSGPVYSLAARRAAIETLAAFPTDVARRHLAKLYNRYATPQSPGQYQSDLHLELIGALAQHDPESRAAIAEVALESSLPEIQTAGLRLVEDLRSSLPQGVAKLAARSSAAPARIAALRLVAARGGDDAVDILKRGTEDRDMSVRLAAIEALGKRKSAAAQQVLSEIRANGKGVVQAAALRALAESGQRDAVYLAARDDSPRLRQTAAELLAQDTNFARAANTMQHLLDDPSGEVQQAAVAALAQWPAQWSGPLLFRTVDHSRSSRARDAAGKILWHRLADGVSQADLAQAGTTRREQMGFLWEQRFGGLGLPRIDSDTRPGRASVTENRALSILAHSTSAAARLNAVENLKKVAASGILSMSAVEEIGRRAPSEPDPRVLTGLLEILTQVDPRSSSDWMQLAARRHEPAVRRMAAVWFYDHPHGRHREPLMRLLADQDATVAEAAVRALGQNGTPADSELIARYLSHPQLEVRLAAATTLSRRSDWRGFQVLRQLAREQEPRVRREVAREMGLSARPEFLGSLLKMLDDHAGVQRVALDSLRQIAGPHQSPDRGMHDTSARIAAWRRWGAAQAVETVVVRR